HGEWIKSVLQIDSRDVKVWVRRVGGKPNKPEVRRRIPIRMDRLQGWLQDEPVPARRVKLQFTWRSFVQRARGSLAAESRLIQPTIPPDCKNQGRVFRRDGYDRAVGVRLRPVGALDQHGAAGTQGHQSNDQALREAPDEFWIFDRRGTLHEDDP